VNYIGGEYIPFRQVHRARLEGLNLWRNDGESTEDWGNRCKDYCNKLERRLFK